MLRRELEAEGSIFQTSSDTEVLLHLIKRSTKDSLIESVKEAFKQSERCVCVSFTNWK